MLYIKSVEQLVCVQTGERLLWFSGRKLTPIRREVDSACTTYSAPDGKPAGGEHCNAPAIQIA